MTRHPLAVETSCADGNSRQLVRKAARRKSLDPTTRSVEFTLSTKAVDRDGDVVSPAGWVLDSYLRNPVVLFGHDAMKPIARCDNIRVEGEELIGRAVFPPKGEVGLADEVFALMEHGALSAFSAGFLPIELSPRKDGDGFLITRQELWEASVVSVPSNREALVRAKAALGGLPAMAAHLDAYLHRSADAEARAAYVTITGAVHESQQAEMHAKNIKAIDKAREKMGPGSLYMRRPVLNGKEIADWAKSNGFEETIAPYDMHVTLAFSRTPVDWSKIAPRGDEITIEGGDRSVVPLGDKGAVVLKIASGELSSRWEELMDAGCSWDYEGYQPHVTLSYKGSPDLSKLSDAYRGPIKLGGEIMEPLDEDWSEKVSHQKAEDMNVEDNEDKASAGERFTSGPAEDGHSHDFELGATETDPAGDPEHVHAISYDENGVATIEASEDHSHETPAEAKIDDVEAESEVKAEIEIEIGEEGDEEADDEEMLTGKSVMVTRKGKVAKGVISIVRHEDVTVFKSYSSMEDGDELLVKVGKHQQAYSVVSCKLAEAAADGAVVFKVTCKDGPAIKSKAGRVLSKSNVERLNRAREAIDEVIASAMAGDDSEEKSEDAMPEEDMVEVDEKLASKMLELDKRIEALTKVPEKADNNVDTFSPEMLAAVPGLIKEAVAIEFRRLAGRV